MIQRMLFFCAVLFSGTALFAQEIPVNIIPKPLLVVQEKGFFHLNASTAIIAAPEAVPVADFFSNLLSKGVGVHLSAGRKKRASKNTIQFIVSKDFPDTTKGAYTLRITPEQVIATAKDREGIFYAVQSLRQILPPSIEQQDGKKLKDIRLPAMFIKDAPRFGWRGYMQDVSRTFYGLEVMKKYLDVMALYKLNTLHFHLTDDQGWRIEIKKHPGLTSEKATTFPAKHRQPAERSGYYTQAQLKELIAYAAERNITIVPEIDVPGHCWPIIITYPELGVNKKRDPDYVIPFMDSWSYWGFQFTPNPLDPTKEEVYAFLDDVFAEVAALFPSKYIHFGGDEVVHRLWENEPHVQAFKKARNMKRVEELQSYFVQRVSEIIVKKGKQPIGWNDILADAEHLPNSTAIMAWLGAGAVKKAAEHGFYAVATPTGPMYFDIQQHSRHDGTMADLNYSGPNRLEDVYAYDPHKGLNKQEQQYVLGVQANMWPAVPQEVKDINVQNFPRLLALAETAWTTPGQKNLSDFRQRLSAHYPRLDALKVDYFKEGGYIVGSWQPSQISTAFKTMKWDVTAKVYANGRMQAGFFFTEGSSFLKIRNVRLLKDGEVVAEDVHESLADKFRGIPFKKNMFFYSFKIDSYDPSAQYTLTAEVAGEQSNDSNGNVTFNLSPYKPFEVTEAVKRKN